MATNKLAGNKKDDKWAARAADMARPDIIVEPQRKLSKQAERL